MRSVNHLSGPSTTNSSASSRTIRVGAEPVRRRGRSGDAKSRLAHLEIGALVDDMERGWPRLNAMLTVTWPPEWPDASRWRW